MATTSKNATKSATKKTTTTQKKTAPKKTSKVDKVISTDADLGEVVQKDTTSDQGTQDTPSTTDGTTLREVMPTLDAAAAHWRAGNYVNEKVIKVLDKSEVPEEVSKKYAAVLKWYVLENGRAVGMSATERATRYLILSRNIVQSITH